MKNELRIKPLRKYEVWHIFADQPDVFTGDTVVRDFEGDVLFFRTGNNIRTYTSEAKVYKIIVTPADDEQVPE